MERILQKIQIFKFWWQGLSLFGQKLPLVLASALFVVLLLYIFFEISETECEAVGVNHEGDPVTMECERGSVSLIDAIVSDGVRNLGLLLVASIGWFFFYWRAKIADQSKKAAEKSAEATRKNAETTEKGLTIERLTRAMEQLSHEKSYVRVGGIRGLEKIAYTQEDSVQIAQILAAFIQTQAAKNSERTRKDIDTYSISKPEIGDGFSIYRAQRLDIEVAVHALASIALMLDRQGYFEEENSKPKSELCDLRNTDLRGLQLNKIDLSGFNLTGVDFSMAWLMRTDFTKAIIGNPSYTTKFIGAFLIDAIFSNVVLCVDFSNSILTGATFDNAYMGNAILDNCCINRTNFETSRNLTQLEINKAFYWDNDSPPLLSDGFNLPPSKPSPIPAPINVGSNNQSTENNDSISS